MDDVPPRTPVTEPDDLSSRLRKTLVSLTAVRAPAFEQTLTLDVVADGFEPTVPAALEIETTPHRQLGSSEAPAAPDIRLRPI
jgi:hypothetical protein